MAAGEQVVEPHPPLRGPERSMEEVDAGALDLLRSLFSAPNVFSIRGIIHLGEPHLDQGRPDQHPDQT